MSYVTTIGIMTRVALYALSMGGGGMGWGWGVGLYSSELVKGTLRLLLITITE